MEPEKPPRTAKSDRKTRRTRPIGERLFGPKPAGGKGKPKHRRISVDHLIGRMWEGVARFAAPMSLPVSRCLQVQSPVAGMIIEDLVAGTVADRVLQPVARAEEKAEKVLALVGPPLLVLAIEQSMLLPPDQMMVRQALLMPILKESLRVWIQVAGPKVEEAARREEEYQEKFGRTIDEMIGLFFGQGADRHCRDRARTRDGRSQCVRKIDCAKSECGQQTFLLDEDYTPGSAYSSTKVARRPGAERGTILRMPLPVRAYLRESAARRCYQPPGPAADEPASQPPA